MLLPHSTTRHAISIKVVIIKSPETILGTRCLLKYNLETSSSYFLGNFADFSSEKIKPMSAHDSFSVRKSFNLDA